MTHADNGPSSIDRRRFLTVLGVSSAGAAVVSGCSTDKVEKLIPYLVQSEDQVPGVATWYSSTCTECAAGCGLHVRTREGRAVKLEGNPDNPINRGKLCSRGQAALQGLYNPGRLKGPMVRAAGGAWQEITWDDAIQRLATKLSEAGAKVAVISGAGRGTFSDLLADWTSAVGGKVTRYHPFDHEPLRAANRAVFGRDELPVHDFARARYIVSFGADFLETWLAPIENQRGFAESHGFHDGAMARHVAFAPRMSLTGQNADEWHAVRPGSEAALVLALANLLVTEHGADSAGLGSALGRFTPDMAAKETGIDAATIRRIANELSEARPSLAVAGGIGSQHRGATELCAAVNILNYVAGNIGKTVLFGGDLDAGDGAAGLEAVASALDGGQVAVLLVHEANPLYALPKSAGFEARFKKAGFKVSTSPYLDETAAQCDLILPNYHALERWDDVRPRAGVVGLMQPVMEPVFHTMATGDVLLKVAQKVGGGLARFNAPTFEAHLKTRWAELAKQEGQADAEAFWRAAVQRGGLYSDRPAPAEVKIAAGVSASYTAPTFDGSGEFYFAPHVSSFLYDGRGTNKPWLLENPDPVSKITWHSWVEVHPDTAARLDVRNGEILRLVSPQGAIEAPVYIYPGIHRDVVSVPLGFGHTEYGAYAKDRGVNALDLLSTKSGQPFVAYLSTKVAVEKTGKYQKLASTEGNPRQLGRHIAEAMPVALAAKGLTPAEADKAEGHPEEEVNTERELEALKGWRGTIQERNQKGNYAGDHHQWGMVIDLAKCTGCSACVTACYAENNIPTVGEDEIHRGRELTWMRIERYWEGNAPADGAPEPRFIPMLCQHCANAPCEPVCPVYAAYHTADGLNAQVYNRCVGTRYCANNCPYKVRYFNWYKYNDRAWPDPLNLQLNPDVTVRARGVMEKCTFCIQRIRGAQNQARLEGRSIKDGEFTTACAQACPSDAIVFGNVNDPESRVRQLKEDRRGYHVLEDVNTRPAVTYLAKVLNRSEA